MWCLSLLFGPGCREPLILERLGGTNLDKTAFTTGCTSRARPWHNADPVKLRNAHLAGVDRHKVVDYLLNGAHPDNGGKAEFFMSLGFSRSEPEWLMAALLAVAQDGEVSETAESVHGEKSVVEGWLSAHTGGRRQQLVRTVWVIDRSSEVPRLVTAYPGRE